MTKAELEVRVRELEEELKDTLEELEFEENIVEGLHGEIRIRELHQKEPVELAKAVHDLLCEEHLFPGDIPWKAAPTAWRQKLIEVTREFL